MQTIKKHWAFQNYFNGLRSTPEDDKKALDFSKTLKNNKETLDSRVSFLFFSVFTVMRQEGRSRKSSRDNCRL